MSTDSPKTYSIKNYGCQMNVYDGERMAEMFESQGMRPADEKANADLVVLNTCQIREKAAEKVYSEIGQAFPPVEGVSSEELGELGDFPGVGSPSCDLG
jgi:tRNA A37 methylthiotransferase MiaB